MNNRFGSVRVKQLPETLDCEYARLLLSELSKTDRPSIVLDCSNMRQMDRGSSLLLLRCLEEAIKSNGDVKLAEVPNGARRVLERTGMGRLFELFDTTADAVNSFRRLPIDLGSHSFDSLQTSENAA